MRPGDGVTYLGRWWVVTAVNDETVCLVEWTPDYEAGAWREHDVPVDRVQLILPPREAPMP